MRYLTVGEVLELYNRVMKQSGGLVESAVAQPRMMFNGEELYTTVVEKLLLWDTRLFKIILLWMVTSVLVMLHWKYF